MTGSALSALVLAACAFAGGKTEVSIAKPQLRAPVAVQLPAMGLEIPAPTPAPIPGATPGDAGPAVLPIETLRLAPTADLRRAEAISGEAAASANAATAAPEADVSAGAAKFDGAASFGAKAAVPAQAGDGGHDASLVEAYQDGRLDAVGATPAQKAALKASAERGMREKLASANFKTYYLYGWFLGTSMYEAPELPGVLLKTYNSPFFYKGRAWKGYSLAKERLGGLFAETAIVENIEVTIEGKKRKLPWALVQERVQVAGTENYARRSTQVLLGMLKRGVRDNDQRQRGIEQMDSTRNLGEAPDGRFVHFDADFFGTEKTAEDPPQRVRDPAVMRDAIRRAQLEALKALRR